MTSIKILNEDVIRIANSLGFDLVGFAAYEKLEIESKRLSMWLDDKLNAGMKYMERNIHKRLDVKQIFPEAISVISLGMNYLTDASYSGDPEYGKLSKYAWGKDYHIVIWEKLELFIDELKKIDADFNAISYADTGPVMDKAWAVKAGLGWLGKHTNIINKSIGSWFFIATVITNYEFKASKIVRDHCGSCTACIDACPTKAIVADYVIDANKCISYLTIENKDDIEEQFQGQMENWLFGCDICQDVCPWNIKFSKPLDSIHFSPRNGETEILLKNILGMNEIEFKERFSDSPILRSKLKGLKRNSEFLLNK